MTEPDHTRPRLRQVALVVADLAAGREAIEDRLGVGEPFADPGVATFGLHNAVYAVGDTFIELVSPTREGTAAGRHRERVGGDGGYMVIVQVPDTAAARRRAEEEGVRVVWSADLPMISGTHLHPRDTGGALLSFDTPQPPEAWEWGGPDWDRRQGSGKTKSLVSATVAATDPAATARRWGALLGVEPSGERLVLDRSEVVFVPADGRPDGLVGIGVAAYADDVSGGDLLGCQLTVTAVPPPS